MNYKKKWQDTLMKRVRQQGEVTIVTRNALEMRYMEELKEVGKIEIEVTPDGWICRRPQNKTT